MCVERHFQPQILFFVESAPTEIDQNLPRKSFFEEEESGKSESGSKDNYEDSSGIFGVGLKNDIGENNCFLNAIIQVLSIPNFEFVPSTVGTVLYPYVVLSAFNSLVFCS